MKNENRREYEYIRRELDLIKKEFADLSYGVRNSCKGIGNEHCANYFNTLSGQIASVQKSMNQIQCETEE